MVRDKVRIRFRKAGDLRLISHHDLMRCFERMLRRAGLPYHSTSGFNPKPRLILALSLSLGVIGSNEVAELELDEECVPAEVHRRLAEQAPDGLVILRVDRIEPRKSAHVRRVTYRLPVPATRTTDLPSRIKALLAADEHWIERSRPETRRLNIRPYVSQLRLLPDALEMDLWVTPNGTARPDEVLEPLGIRDLLAQGAVLERTHLELEDEVENALPQPSALDDRTGSDHEPKIKNKGPA
jgi:radical SAM-linked protein